MCGDFFVLSMTANLVNEHPYLSRLIHGMDIAYPHKRKQNGLFFNIYLAHSIFVSFSKRYLGASKNNKK